MKSKKQVKIGLVLSYLLIILQTIYGLFMTPFIVNSLGVDEYGVYKTISAITASMMVMDLGLGGTVTRYVASFVADKKENEIPNFMAMNVIQAGILAGVIMGLAAGIYQFIGPIYGDSFTAQQLQTAKIIFIILSCNVAIHVIENVFNGLVKGYNHFIFGNGVMMARLLARIALVFIVLSIYGSSIALVLIDLCVTVIFFVVELIYIRFKLRVTVKFQHWDKSLFVEAGVYSILMFITSIISQVESNLDNVVIGAFAGPALVTVYSVGLTIFSMYLNLSSSVSGIMLPTVTKILREDDWKRKMQRVIVKTGRFQFLLLGAVVIGFLCLGKDFINVWMGKGFSDAYYITLLLMIPSLLELCVNVCLTVLRAKNMIGFRTAIVFATTILNLIVTIILVKNWSYFGAAIGTAINYIIGSVLIMNIYYRKKLGFNMLKIYKGIFSKIWLCQIATGIVVFFNSRWLHGTWFSIVVNVILFFIVYGILLMVYGLNKEEKKTIPLLRKYVKD